MYKILQMHKLLYLCNRAMHTMNSILSLLALPAVATTTWCAWRRTPSPKSACASSSSSSTRTTARPTTARGARRASTSARAGRSARTRCVQQAVHLKYYGNDFRIPHTRTRKNIATYTDCFFFRYLKTKIRLWSR